MRRDVIHIVDMRVSDNLHMNRMIRRTSSLLAAVTGAALLLAACQGDEPVPAPRTPVDVQVNLELSATEITLGDSVRLQWQATAAEACTATGAWSGARAIAGDETVTPTQTGVQTFTLRCTGTGAPAERSTTLTVRPVVPPPPQDVVLEFSGAPLELLVGDSLRLTWSATHAQSCEAGGNWSGAKAIAGTETVAATTAGVQRYELTCRGAAAPATARVDALAVDPFVEARAEFLRLRALENTP